tara:strand:- start:190 stop:816 length:627 start_codon:yes stop_codon:yes gene_type:complete
MSQTKAQLINAVDGSIVDADITGLSSSKLSGALPAISGAALTNLDAGKILQVKQTVKTSFFSTSTTGSGVDVTGVSVTITPASSSNKILVRCFGEYGNDNNDSFASLSIARVLDGSTDTGIAVGDARGSTTRATMNATLRSGGGLSHNVSRHFGCEFLDSPNTTNAIIYKLRIFVVQGTPACVGGSDSDNFNNFVSTPTFITAMEVAA